MRDKKNPLSNIIEFSGQKGWISKTCHTMAELQSALSDLEAFNECYFMFSPKNVTPANKKNYEQSLKENVKDKLAECFVMLEGVSVIFGEEEVTGLINMKGKQLFTKYEEELTNCIAVADYMQRLGNKLKCKK